MYTLQTVLRCTAHAALHVAFYSHRPAGPCHAPHAGPYHVVHCRQAQVGVGREASLAAEAEGAGAVNPVRIHGTVRLQCRGWGGRLTAPALCAGSAALHAHGWAAKESRVSRHQRQRTLRGKQAQ